MTPVRHEIDCQIRIVADDGTGLLYAVTPCDAPLSVFVAYSVHEAIRLAMEDRFPRARVIFDPSELA